MYILEFKVRSLKKFAYFFVPTDIVFRYRHGMDCRFNIIIKIILDRHI